MTMAEPQTTRGPVSTLSEIAQALRDSPKVVVASHENPDGDAIGSVRSAGLILEAIGCDVVTYVPGAVLPAEYQFIAPDAITDVPPADLSERTLLALDCGNALRLACPELLSGAARVLNIDHHADNTHFGDLNVVAGLASCTTQLVRDLARELGVELTPKIATAIYVGLVTDTGRFQYSNTTADSLHLAAELVEAGTEVHEIFREVYECVEYPRLKLLARGLEHAHRYASNRIIVTHLTRRDFIDAEADDDAAEGVVDFLRGVEGTDLALFVRDLEDPSAKGARKGSLRTTRDDVDVSAIARIWNGGGHRQAAGFSTDDSMDVIIKRVVEAHAVQRGQ